MSGAPSSAVETARDYYNSEDADRFYASIWGGEDIHIGLYDRGDEPIAEASRRTVEHMASQVRALAGTTRVLDIGAGYGGAARYLAKTFGCRVTALNLSEVENERNRTLSREQGLEDFIDVVDGNFEDLPFEDGSFDLVWSQDAFLHSGCRETVVAEAARVMCDGAELVFTDPMQTDGRLGGVLQPILDRIHLETLGSPGFYREQAAARGLREIGFENLTPQLVAHYSRVLDETRAREEALLKRVDAGYVHRMKQGLQHWIDGGRLGYLVWGVFRFAK